MKLKDKANNDLISAHKEYSIYPPNYHVANYWCSQSIEKYFRGYLEYNDFTNYPKVHDLNTLANLCKLYNQ